MRGLLVCPISADFPGNRGILNKMAYQRAALAELAGATDVICNAVSGPLLNGDRFAEYKLTGRPFNSYNHFVLFYRHVSRCCRSGGYDFVYIRYPLATPSFLRFLRETKKTSPAAKIIVEVPTFPYRQELRSPKQRVLLALDDFGHRRLKNYVDVIVTFFGQSEIFGIPCIQIANGVDVESIPVQPSPSSGERVSMIIAANFATWHGVDRMLRGLAAHLGSRGATPVTLGIVGDGPSVAELRELTGDLGLQDVVTFHGIRAGAELDALFAGADLALGSLGMHRLGLHRSSSLKTREYCARGIPFVLASDDPDFPEGTPFVHRVPGDDSAVDVTAMVDFLYDLRERNPDCITNMRRYAGAHLTWKAKLEPAVQYVRTGEVQTERKLP